MRLVSPFLRKVVYPTLAMSGVFRRIAAGGLAVVTYHGVVPPGYRPVDAAFDGNLVSAKSLGQQVRRLKARYNVISPEDVLAWRQGECELPHRAVLLTCDDGLLNCLTDMLPVLQEEGVKCLFFITGNAVAEASTGEGRSRLWYEELFLLILGAPAGQFEVSYGGITIASELGSREQRRAMWWTAVMRLSQVDAETRGSFLSALRERLGSRGRDPEDSVSCRRFGLMNGEELRRLAAAGMTIGAHTMSHPILAQLPVELARAEVAESRSRLEAALQQRVWAFAYPFGDAPSVTAEVMALPEQAGYTAAFLNYGGGLGAQLPAYALPRIHVTSEMSLSELEAHVSGFYRQLRQSVSG